MLKAGFGSKPMYLFSETDKTATIEMIIDGVKVTKKYFSPKRPNNATVLETTFEERSMNYAIEFNGRIYRFQVNRLPSRISPKKTKIEYDHDCIRVILKKKDTCFWHLYTQYDLEAP